MLEKVMSGVLGFAIADAVGVPAVSSREKS